MKSKKEKLDKKLDELTKRADRAFNALSPEEQKEYLWIRSEWFIRKEEADNKE